jgi:DNA-binding transcriptional ArsR family regulator
MNINDEKAAQIFRALGNPARLTIVKGLLKHEECNVNKMVKALAIPQSTVSQHLAVLKASGVIRGERRGVEVCYSVVDPFVKKILALLPNGGEI